MSAYLCDQHTINAIATYAADHGLVADPALFADLLTCMNVLALRTRYRGRDFLPEMVSPAKVYRFERVEAGATAVEALAKEYAYQACEVDDYDATLCARLVAKIVSHAGAIKRLERPGGCGADLSDHPFSPANIRYECGEDTPDERRFSRFCADVSRRLGVNINDGDQATDGYSLDWAHDMWRDGVTAAECAAEFQALMSLVRPGGCGAAIVNTSVYWTAKSVNKKTGPMPVSTTSAETCPSACPLLGNGCYAKGGNVGILWHALTRHGPNASWKHGASMARSIDWKGLCERVAGLDEGTLWRHNQAGDLPHRKQRILKGKLVALVRANRGRRGFTYTHHIMSAWNRALVRWANATGFTINLSANTLAHADELSESGAGPVVVVQAFYAPRQDMTPAGRVVRTCPATYAAVTCKQCQWCALPKRSWIVGFPPHGGQKNAADAVARGL